MYVSRSERAGSALASAAVVALLGAALVLGLRPAQLTNAAGALVAVVFTPPSPTPSPSPSPKPRPRADGGGAPRAPAPMGARPHRAPEPRLPMPVTVIPVPVLPAPVASPLAGAGAAGTGPGAGGAGAGSGGGSGMGAGAGEGAGIASEAEQVHGSLKPSDLADGVLPPGTEAGVKVHYTVGIDGRVNDCRVIRSSGYPVLDAVPCPLIERRFRFRPARDRAGQAVPSTIAETHTWIEPPAKEDRRR